MYNQHEVEEVQQVSSASTWNRITEQLLPSTLTCTNGWILPLWTYLWPSLPSNLEPLPPLQPGDPRETQEHQAAGTRLPVPASLMEESSTADLVPWAARSSPAAQSARQDVYYKQDQGLNSLMYHHGITWMEPKAHKSCLLKENQTALHWLAVMAHRHSSSQPGFGFFPWKIFLRIFFV